jgi:hypothetical protein
MLNRRENVKKCYVCHREVNGEGVYLTDNTWRHRDCFIGSPNWFKFKKESKYNFLFETKGEVENDRP